MTARPAGKSATRGARIAAAAAALVLALVPGAAVRESFAEGDPVAAGALPLFGYNEDWGTHLDKLGLAAEGGAEAIRTVLSWQAVEPTRGARDWSRYDALYQRLLETGTRPLWVLADAPCWASSARTARCRERNKPGRPPLRRYDGEWARFAGAVVERYPGTVAVETWNEPNLDDFWRPRPDPWRAAMLTAWTNYGVKSVDPDVPVLLGGLAPLTRSSVLKGEVSYGRFIREAYAATGPGFWDAVAIHPFPRFKARGEFLSDILGHLDAMRAALAAAGAAGTPIWVTEVGLSTGGPFPYTPKKQAEGLVRTYEALAQAPDVPAVIVHRLVDLPPRVRTAEAGWGVLNRAGTPKPSFCALARLIGGAC